ncbi:methionyl-tRNA formyltransferase [Nonomuraea fuscirosea]|jgi:methionyl-tRNA formyltransferase|uniref:methionyl-tRNA formyltransferase n=1 Tax=Nonomuraea fuscirosea TaxID=1291556 RepID=UPI002DDBE063|nr:methionyl-tRNA formyltransferase [Nonomuraea fuscirosea]WSA48007.1 methionyl-tRNA formyltransferase [Nonomuraea fuscirosea]
MRLVFAGTPETALPSLRTLIDSPRHDVVAVVTRPDAQSGRGRKVHPSPVAELAEEAGIEVLRPQKAGDPAFLDRLRALAPDCCPVVAYGALLPQVALDIPRHGWINLHFSLLPAWRGAAPVQHAILHGDEITGASTFQIVKELDAGPVYGVVTEEIRASDTSGTLLERLSVSGAGLLAATLDGVEDGTLEARPQPADGVTIAPKISVADARVDWTKPAMHVDRLIRACTPGPGAWTEFRGQRVKLGAARVVEGERPAPGEIVATKTSVLVGTATDALLLGEVQPQGKRLMQAGEWARGVRPEAKESFT